MQGKVFSLVVMATLTMISFSALTVNASPLDERLFVGTWAETYNTYTITIEWRSDGTGTDSYDDGTPSWNFEWKIEDGEYFVREDSSYEWWKMDYKFSSLYSKLSLSDSSVDLNLERDGNVCCSVCCGNPDR